MHFYIIDLIRFAKIQYFAVISEKYPKFVFIKSYLDCESMKLSIIVPVYNVEKHLMRCLESIVPEMCDDYELILVDDGSTDASGTLCDDFSVKHPQLHIVVMHQANGGLSAARNQGLDVARGEYVTFVDSDDYISTKSIVDNMAYMLMHPEVDMLEYPVEVYAESSKVHMLTFVGETRRDDIFADWIRREGYTHCYAWNKIYRAALWKNVRFPIGKCFEDVAVMPDIIRQCHCIYYSSCGCYHYVRHNGSITTSYRYHKQKSLFEGNQRLYLEIKDDASLQIEALHLWVYCLNQLIDMGRCADADKTEYVCVVNDVNKHHPSYKILLKATPNFVTRIKLFPLFLLGLQTYCRLYVALTKPLFP